jgi:hypothetical protein
MLFLQSTLIRIFYKFNIGFFDMNIKLFSAEKTASLNTGLITLILLACVSLFGYTTAFALPRPISNEAEWEDFAKNGPLSGDFILTSDIGSPANPVTQMVGGSFSGTFDGGGHTP